MYRAKNEPRQIKKIIMSMEDTEMKKKMLTVLALVLVVVAVVVVCTSCAKMEEAKEETAKIRYTLVNQTGEAITNITMKEKIGTMNQVWTVEGMAVDQESALEVNTVVENGAPSIDFAFSTGSGKAFQTLIMEKGDKTIVMKSDSDNGVVAEITGK